MRWHSCQLPSAKPCLGPQKIHKCNSAKMSKHDQHLAALAALVFSVLASAMGSNLTMPT